MQKVYTSESALIASHIRNVLENNGIQCIVKNENLQSVIGEVPPIAAWPEVWVIKSSDLEKAQCLVKAINQEAAGGGKTWNCEQCKETNEPNFRVCWSCGQSFLE